MIYFASSQRNYLSGAHDYYDLWVFDQCHSTEDEGSIMGAAEAGTSVFNNNLFDDRRMDKSVVSNRRIRLSFKRHGMYLLS